MSLDNMLRLPGVLAATGMSRSTVYQRISERRFPRPIPLGSPRMVGWRASEVEACNAAIVRGADAAEIRALVASLEAERQGGVSA